IRRFLLHIVPDGFVRIRHFGILSNRDRKRTLDRCRRLLGKPISDSSVVVESTRALMLRLTGTDIELCPHYRRGRWHVAEQLPRLRLVVLPNGAWDTSCRTPELPARPSPRPPPPTG